MVDPQVRPSGTVPQIVIGIVRSCGTYGSSLGKGIHLLLHTLIIQPYAFNGD